MAGVNEVVAEAAEEVAEQAEHVAKVSRALTGREMRIGTLAGFVGMAAGAGIAYFVLNKKLNAKYTEIAEGEISLMRDHYKAKTDATMSRVQKPELNEVVNELGYQEAVDGPVIAVKEEAVVVAVEEDETPPPFETHNVFEEAPKDVWDYATEVKSRDPLIQYVIHVDEFNANEKGYTQSTLTYYMDDDVLADEHDSAIDDQDDTVGVKNLDMFGHGSGDPNVVYVRNDIREIDYEIVRSNGSYAEEVHGLPTIEHSLRPRRRAWDG
jgi:hypothetical protein